MIDTGAILDGLAAEAWFADRTKVLRFINKAGLAGSPDVVARLGQEVEGCHKPGTVEKLRALYAEWERGGRQVDLYTRKVEGGTKYNVLLPVHGAQGFEGVLELTFRIEGE